MIPLVNGAVLVFAVFGVGRFVLWLLNLRTLPWHWHFALAALFGQATINFLVQSLLLSGRSSTHRLRLLGWLIIVAGLSAHALAKRNFAGQYQIRRLRVHNFLVTLLLAIWLTNLFVALAPSSKIDEIFYHMLVPKRIAAEGAINYYRLPIEAAIMPQMQFQISLSPFYALGAPEAGNVLSASYSIVLALFILGFIHEATGNDSLALLGALGCVVGAYQTVWHTTEGATALGELALVVAACSVLWPKLLLPKISPLQYGVVVATAASLAASTKISLLPLCTIISLLAVWRIHHAKHGTVSPGIRTAIVLWPWILIHLPLMAWTYYKSGSFWGPVMANIFRPSIFPPSLLEILNQMRIINQTGFLLNLRVATVVLSPLIFIGICFALWDASRGSRTAAAIIGFLLFQGVLIWWQLPYDFRFLGGLLYLPWIATVLTLATPNPDARESGNLTPVGKRLVKLQNWIALTTVVPWLAFQMYYARPFAEVVAGISTKAQFRERFVAMSQDYEVLDRILPRDAVLYIPNGRFSLVDAPRPTVLTPLDLRQRTSIFRLTIKTLPEQEVLDASSILNCHDVVYSNDHAVIEVYRLPGRLPKTGMITVRSCQIEAAN